MRKCNFSMGVFAFAIFAAATLAHAEPVKTPPLTPQEPITLEGKNGLKYEFQSFDAPLGISLESCNDVTIFCCDLHSIKLVNCRNVTIQNCWIHDSADIGISAGACHGLKVQGCRLEKVATGLYACGCDGVQFTGNYAENMMGPFPRGSMVQFDTVTGAGNLIQGNYVVNYKGKSHPEDCINLFKCEGTADSPIVVENNYVMGDPVAGNSGKSESGSGIMLGDYGGKNIICRKNVVINAGQCGVGVAAGDAISVEDNIIIGTKSEVANNGLYAWAQAGAAGGVVSFARNDVYWVNKAGEPNSWWQGSGFKAVKLADNKFDDQSLVNKPFPTAPTKAPMPPGPIARDGAVSLPWKAE